MTAFVRRVVLVALALLLAAAFAFSAQAQSYPNADIHFVTGFPPGSGADVITRYFAEKLRPVAGRTILVENKVGASGAISIEDVARSKPDGYTILFNAGSATAASMHLMKSPPVDVLKAFEIAATINRQAFMLVVDAKSPYHSVPELTAAMKQKGEKASYATAAPSGIVMGEMYKAITGVKAVEVRYKDAVGSLNELMDGKLDYGMHDPVFSLAQAREGRLRILAHSSGTRLNAIPDVPTMAESGVPGMDLTSWWALHVPAGTPAEVKAACWRWRRPRSSSTSSAATRSSVRRTSARPSSSRMRRTGATMCGSPRSTRSEGDDGA